MRKRKVGSYTDILKKDVYESIPSHLLDGPWTYETIQTVAGILNCSVDELCGLHKDNDPFYCGAPNHRNKADWIHTRWPEIMKGRSKISERTIHYWLSTGKVPFPQGYKGGKAKDGTQKPHYMNDEACIPLCNIAVKYARNLELISSSQIVDEKTSEPRDYSRRFLWLPARTELSWIVEEPDLPGPDLPNLSFPSLPSFEIDAFDVPQKYHVEIWTEKSTMNHILEPLAKKYKAVFQDLSGESSATRVSEAADRIKTDGRPTRIGYISDHDPAGENMPRAMCVKLQHDILKIYPDADVRVYPILLTEEQVDAYNLERIPLKETEARGKKFEAMHNKEGGVELDALEAKHPGLLREIVAEWLDGYFDHDLEGEVESAEEELRGMLDDIEEDVLEPLQDRVKALEEKWNEMREEIEKLTEPVFEERDKLWKEAYDLLDSYAVGYSIDDMPQPEYAEENPYPLLDSRRKQIIQNLFYQAQKRGIPLETVQKQIDESCIDAYRNLAG